MRNGFEFIAIAATLALSLLVLVGFFWFSLSAQGALPGVGFQAAFWLAVITLGGCVFAGIYTMSRLSGSVGRMIAAIDRARTSNLLAEVAVDSPREAPDSIIRLQARYNDMVHALNASQANLRRIAFRDGVTHLANREGFQTLVDAQCKQLSSDSSAGAMLFVDIDGFHAINAQMGHDWGNEVLRAVADALGRAVETVAGTKPHGCSPGEHGFRTRLGSPSVGRVGGDEFAVFLPGIGEGELLSRLAEAIRFTLNRPLPEIVMDMPETSLVLRASIGVSVYPQHGASYERLLRMAELAMFHAKQHGGNRWTLFCPEIGETTVAELMRQVSEGLLRGEFDLHYQPKVDSSTGAIMGVEALARWNHPKRGFLLPEAFVPVVEMGDVAIELGDWVIRQAATQSEAWRKAGIDLPVAINIAARHFGRPDFAENVTSIVKSINADPRKLQFELTEETVLSSIGASHGILEKLQAAGFEISLDDFGRGYSNLTRLAHLAVNAIKIDGPLTALVAEDERTRVIIASTIAMAHGLGAKTVAEGVESIEQAHILAELGCDQLQGYFFARPMPAEAIADWVAQRGDGAVVPINLGHARLDNHGRTQAV